MRLSHSEKGLTMKTERELLREKEKAMLKRFNDLLRMACHVSVEFCYRGSHKWTIVGKPDDVRKAAEYLSSWLIPEEPMREQLDSETGDLFLYLIESSSFRKM